MKFMKNFKYAIVLDFEASCDDIQAPRPQEIIEFPSIAVSLSNFEIIGEFSSFVKPFHNPQLSDFCKNFTSISQEDMDGAELFSEVLKKYLDWLSRLDLNIDNSIIVTCGDWDLGTMFPAQCSVSVPAVEQIPPLFTRWHNIKQTFCSVRNTRKAPGMAGMLKNLGLQLLGHHHRGIDDCRNITEILKFLVREGGKISATKELPLSKYPPITLNMRLRDEMKEIRLETRDMKALNSLAGKTFKKKISQFYRHDRSLLEGDHHLKTLIPGEEILLIE